MGDLLFEMQGQVGALPLLQFTLDQLFQRPNGRQLTLSAYRDLGGVKGALTRQAEETYAALPSDEHRKLARALFVRLIDPGATEQDTTRRRAARSEFSLADAGQTRLLQEVADSFIAARLLTTNEIAGPDIAPGKLATIEVSHEALIREWPRLAAWLREARDDISHQQNVSQDAAEWEQHNKPGDRLYRGSQLKEARAWTSRNTPSGNEVTFRRAYAANRIRYVASVTVIVLLLLSTTGLIGWFLTRPDPTRVTNLQDEGTGSLRQDIALAPPKSTITFDTSLRGTILLSGGDLNIAKDLTIRVPGAGLLSISGGKSGHIVRVVQGASITISGLTFKDDKTLNGFIDNEGTLTLSNSTVSGNTVTGLYSEGGGISNYGTLTLSNSTISGNTANSGGGIAISDHDVTGTVPVHVMLLYCTVYGNTANVGGGGIWVDNFDKKSQVTMGASIVARNSAHTGPDIVGRLTTLGYNLVGNRSGSTFLGSPKVQSTDVLGVSFTDLKVDLALQDNGGSARPHTWTHALLLGVRLSISSRLMYV